MLPGDPKNPAYYIDSQTLGLSPTQDASHKGLGWDSPSSKNRSFHPGGHEPASWFGGVGSSKSNPLFFGGSNDVPRVNCQQKTFEVGE